MLQLPDLSLYIHFPWCVQKCPYCDFNSHTLKQKMPDEAYLEDLIEDLNNHKSDLQARKFKTLFLGGGTPSLFPKDKLSKLFDYLFKENLIEKNAEITLEANPGTIERDHFYDYKEMGINRISLGVQSFQNDKLKSLGRIHNDEQVYQAVDELYKSGLTNFNIDLMHGLPNQSKEDALFDLNEAIKLKPKHISWYQLTIEPNTPFAAKPPILPNDNILESIEISGKQLLEENNFKQYEISAFAKEGFQAKHNLNYWRFGDYIGIGAGAHGKITYPDENKIKRIWKIKHPKLYLQSKNYIADSQLIKPEERIYEFMLNALRLKNGVEKELLNITTNIDFNSIENAYQKAINLGLLNNHKIQIKPTEKGFLFLNDLINLFAL